MMEDFDGKPSASGVAKNDHELEIQSHDVKPALKRDRISRNRDKHLQWDEVAIEEHNVLRGTRMTIDEPKTPYVNYDSGAESDDSHRVKSPATDRTSICWDTLQNRLDTVAAVREQYPSPPSDHVDTDNSDVEVDQDKEMRKLEFREHRRRHYNEFEYAKKFRAEVVDDDEDDDNHDDNGADNGNNKDYR